MAKQKKSLEERRDEDAAARSERKFQELGRKIVGGFFMIIRSLKLYDIENDIFVKPLHELESAINWVVAKEGLISLYGSSSTIYLNQTLLKFDRNSLENVNFLLKEFEQRELAGFTVEHPITLGQLQEFLQYFRPEVGGAPLSSSAFRAEPLKKIREKLNQIEEEELEKVKNQKADRRRYAVLLYGRLLRYIRTLYDPEAQNPGERQAIHILQEIIDLCKGHPVQFLGFSNETDPREYQHYHIANTVLLALLFGDYLGLERSQLLELGQITIKHDLGKMSLPPEILEKKGELTPEERREIERLPLYTVRSLLDGGFDWRKMKAAIIAAGLTLRPAHEEPLPMSETVVASPSWLYSRVISLCTCFDALCTRRPYRPKMEPGEALVFMQQRLGNQFDPYLLDRFSRLFRPMIVKAIGGKKMPRQAPQEPRQMKKKLAPPVLQSLHAEIEEYRMLKRMRQRTQEQEHRLDFLRKFLAYRLKDMQQQKIGGALRGGR
ncbi:MAG: hypothetical protein CL920_39030 [Deltaproteobacteria bacterium]|nr:hypothetical protein [Deltaproteobacteria bacterium]|tara:strand:+ start:28649 stop:30127 length:1479 start_codon:yes stop_codon:yes gene_type:complete